MQAFFKTEEFSLSDWKKVWLQTSSLNVIESSWNPQDHSEKATLTIKQTPYTPEHPTLRPHKIKVAFFFENCEFDVMEVLVRPQPETVIEYNGSKQYKAVLLNYEDHGYLKNRIDNVSL